MRAEQIFISYRRDDAAGYARAVYDELARHFGADRVFIDVDDIRAGQPFSEVIERAMGDSQVLLVLIGKRWQGEREPAPPRIAEAGDLVRQEVAAGLAKGMRVIPLLLDGAAMPTEAQLPEALRALAGRNALEIGNTRFAADIERLVAALREALGEPPPPPLRPRRAATAWVLGGALLLAAASAGLWQWRAASRGGDSLPLPDRRAASAALAIPSATRPEINGEWQADVTYDWPNARHAERFVFGGDGVEVYGNASFLGVARGLLEGRAEPDGLRFVTRTSESSGAAGASAEAVHRYRGRLVGSEIRFVMQTEGGASPHVPIEFVARRVGVGASQAGR